MTDQDRANFMGGAGQVRMQLDDGTIVTLSPKIFSSGSVGWYFSGKLTISEMQVQGNIIMTVVGSKPDWVPYSERSKQVSTPANGEPVTPQALFDAEKASAAAKKPRKRS